MTTTSYDKTFENSVLDEKSDSPAASFIANGMHIVGDTCRAIGQGVSRFTDTYIVPVVNTVLVPIKAHWFCCGVVKPLIMAGVLGPAAEELIENLPAELALLAPTTLAVTYATMRAKQAWDARKEKQALAKQQMGEVAAKQPKHAHHGHDDCACPAPAHGFTRQQFWKQAAISYGLGVVLSVGMHFVVPHHEDSHAAPHVKTMTETTSKFRPVLSHP